MKEISNCLYHYLMMLITRRWRIYSPEYEPLSFLHVVWFECLVMYYRYFHRSCHHSIDRPSMKTRRRICNEELMKIYFWSNFTIRWRFFLLRCLWKLNEINHSIIFSSFIVLTIVGRMGSCPTKLCLRHICSKWYLVGFSKRVGTV